MIETQPITPLPFHENHAMPSNHTPPLNEPADADNFLRVLNMLRIVGAAHLDGRITVQRTGDHKRNLELLRTLDEIAGFAGLVRAKHGKQT